MKGVRVLDQCPDVKFILNHCGNADPVAFFPADRISPRKPEHDPEEWYRKMELLAQRSNLVCKISGLVDNVLHYPLTAADLSPIVHFCLEEFGPDRVMFGGDWPVCERNMSLRAWVELLKELVRPMPVCHQRKLFYDNAQAFYGLS
jgi:predicted TIM-barrel fold metal-dependent hydrolase